MVTCGLQLKTTSGIFFYSLLKKKKIKKLNAFYADILIFVAKAH